MIDPISNKIFSANPNRVWAYIPESMNKLIQDKRILFPEDDLKRPMLKRFKNELKSDVNPVSTWMTSVGLNSQATREIQELLESNIFQYSKPLSLIEKIISSSTTRNDIILDFFSGSATTAHAVMHLNSVDRKERKYITIQLPEVCGKNTEAAKAGYKNICEIGKERIRRAGEKIKAELTEKQSAQQTILDDKHSIDPESLDIGFKVFKLDSSNLKKWNPDYDNLEDSLEGMVSNYVEGRTELDVVYEIMLKYGIDLTFPVEEYDFSGKKVYSIGFGALVICLDNDITTALAQDIIKLKNELSPESMRVVFKDNGFINDAAKTNVKENLRQAGIDEFVTV